MRPWLPTLLYVMCAAAAAAEAPAARPAADLIRDLGSNDRAARLLAAEGLRDQGRSAAAAVPALAKLLEDDDGRVRTAAAEALGAIGAPSMPALFTYLKHDKFEVRA
ncbi:MAG: HEAT repeat domain-containing protein, partial [Planctomycetota bacterium]|nr:HEAT repeat domain-containing protein [Planctomycetota bacterium]